MWLCLNNAFLSIVEPNRADKGASPVLKVRARRPGDIERVFPGYAAEVLDGHDYMFRALIPRDVVASAVAAQVLSTNYDNFKNSVKDDALHGAYNRVWDTMSRQQPQPPYSAYNRVVPRRAAQRALNLDGAAPSSRVPRKRPTAGG